MKNCNLAFLFFALSLWFAPSYANSPVLCIASSANSNLDFFLTSQLNSSALRNSSLRFQIKAIAADNLTTSILNRIMEILNSPHAIQTTGDSFKRDLIKESLISKSNLAIDRNQESKVSFLVQVRNGPIVAIIRLSNHSPRRFILSHSVPENEFWLELSTYIHPDFTNQGLGTRLKQILVDHALNYYKADGAFSEISSNNTASIRSSEKIGMSFLYSHKPSEDSNPHNHRLYYGIRRSHYEKN